MEEDTESDQSMDSNYGSDTGDDSDSTDSSDSYESAGSGEDDSDTDSSYSDDTSDDGEIDGSYESAESDADESDADTSTGVEDASFVHPPSEWGQRVGQFWSGVGDWAGGTASSAVHLGEWAWDSATGDQAAAEQREADMSQDWKQITHGMEEIADLM